MVRWVFGCTRWPPRPMRELPVRLWSSSYLQRIRRTLTPPSNERFHVQTLGWRLGRAADSLSMYSERPTRRAVQWDSFSTIALALGLAWFTHSRSQGRGFKPHNTQTFGINKSPRGKIFSWLRSLGLEPKTMRSCESGAGFDSHEHETRRHARGSSCEEQAPERTVNVAARLRER